MNAVLRRSHSLQPMGLQHLDAVMAIEVEAYPFPWTRGNFIDSLASGYPARVLFDGARCDHLIGYFVAMEGVDEMHLLNLAVAPAEQRCGHGRVMLDALVSMCHELRAPQLWLEVRESNTRPRAMYRRYGFREVGVRRGYYPAAEGQREDACVMSLDLSGGTA
jgi:ribosomal-protein-alanine N-acetyltransferase